MKEKIFILARLIRGNPRRSAVIFLAALIVVFFLVPVSRERLRSGGSMRIYSKEGTLLRQFNPSDGAASIRWLPLNEFPAHIKEYVIAAEDRRFYYHPGFDPLAIARASVQNIRAMKIVSGGSTITQQSARMLYAEVLPRNIILKKFCEIIFAIKLEIHLTKDEILEVYLNRILMKFNQQGLPAASVRVFGRDIRFISRAESAALVVLIRRNQASVEMFRERFADFSKKISLDETGELEGIERNLFSKGGFFYTSPHSVTPHFEEFVRSAAGDVAGDVKTSISANLNESVNRIIKTELKFLARYNVENAAVIVLSLPHERSGRAELAAMVGSENFYEGDSGQVNGCTSIRLAGSTLKPLLYGLAMDSAGYEPWSIINDAPLTVATDKGETWSPKNNDMAWWGPITIREALACSRNIPAVYLAGQIGIPALYKFLLKAGFTHMDRGPDFYGPGLALGAGGASLLQLCRAYTAIACGGLMYPLYIGTGINGREIYYGRHEKLFTEKTSYRLIHILSDNKVRRRAYGTRNFLDFPFDVAVKTGTSKDFRDAWTIGFTEDYLVGVWVGNFSGKMMNSVSGGWGAGRIFHQVIRTVTDRKRPHFRYPEHLSMVRFCRLSGLPAGPYCSYSMELVDHTDSFTSECNICSRNSSASGLYSRGNEPEVLSPVNGETFVIDPTLPSGVQQIPLRIIMPRDSAGKYYYSIDSKKKQPLERAVETVISLVRGSHRLDIYNGERIIRTVMFKVE
jgi:penicillin-binding protein 1C